MDATYKTCKVAVPLFFLVVKTNVGYQCVAAFITQTEDGRSIEEALRLIRNELEREDVTLGSFMVDYSAAEIGAIQKVFPGERIRPVVSFLSQCCVVFSCHGLLLLLTEAELYLCEFHRKQAWKRWLKRTENGVYKQEQEAAYAMLCNVADQETEAGYNAAVERMRGNPLWLRNGKLQEYYKTVWEPKYKVSAAA